MVKYEGDVWSELNGGLGNQLFQLAMGFAFSKRFNYTLNLDLRGCDSSESKYCEFHLTPLLKYLPVNQVLRYERAKERITNKLYFTFHNPTHISRQDSVKLYAQESVPKKMFLSHNENNFFAREANKYKFQNIISEFRADIARKVKIRTVEGSVYSASSLGDFVALHLRGRDFVGSQSFTPLDWYTKVSSKHFKGSRVLIFSDDIVLATRLQSRLAGSNIVKESEFPIYDLVLASLCEAHILSSSTFSFWMSNISDSNKIFSPLPQEDIFAPIRPYYNL